MQNLMLRLGMEEDVPIESKLITKRIAAAQKAVEAQNFASRKHVLEYDDVMNKQRQAVYGMRRALLEGEDQKERVLEIIEGIVAAFIDMRCPRKRHPSDVRLDRPARPTSSPSSASRSTPRSCRISTAARSKPTIHEQLLKRYAGKGRHDRRPSCMRETERMIMLNVIDNQWKDHLLSMDHLKEGIGLRGYGQKDPLIEYKKESFVLFQDMMDRIEDESHPLPVLPAAQRTRPGLRTCRRTFRIPNCGTTKRKKRTEGEPEAVGVGRRTITAARSRPRRIP